MAGSQKSCRAHQADVNVTLLYFNHQVYCMLWLLSVSSKQILWLVQTKHRRLTIRKCVSLMHPTKLTCSSSEVVLLHATNTETRIACYQRTANFHRRMLNASYAVGSCTGSWCTRLFVVLFSDKYQTTSGHHRHVAIEMLQIAKFSINCCSS